MSLKNPAVDLCALLTGQTLASVPLVNGTNGNLFPTHMRNVEATTSPAVFIFNSGGPGPDVLFGSRRSAIYHPVVQVMVRGPAGDDAAGEALARAVLAYLAQLVPAGYIGLFVQGSQPTPLGEDSTQHQTWSFYVECRNAVDLA
jgi:hypothetical protein